MSRRVKKPLKPKGDRPKGARPYRGSAAERPLASPGRQAGRAICGVGAACAKTAAVHSGACKSRSRTAAAADQGADRGGDR